MTKKSSFFFFFLFFYTPTHTRQGTPGRRAGLVCEARFAEWRTDSRAFFPVRLGVIPDGVLRSAHPRALF